LGASGALAGAGAEAASLAIAKELYPEAFDADGTFHRDRLSEGQANAILALSGAVGAFVGGVSGGGIYNVVIENKEIKESGDAYNYTVGIFSAICQ
jgi:hypothetical protein